MAKDYVKKIDHIGVVVTNIKAGIEKYRNILFQDPTYTEYFERTKLDLAFFDVGGVSIELLAPRELGSEVDSFLKEKGEGIHHICYEVDDLEGTLETLKAKGFTLIDEEPRTGSRNSRIAFVNPISTGGVLTEYCQFPKT